MTTLSMLLLILLALAFVLSGPLATLLVLIMLARVSKLEARLRDLTAEPRAGRPSADQSPPPCALVPPPPAVPSKPAEPEAAPRPADRPAVAAPPAAALSRPTHPPSSSPGWEQKIGAGAALVAGIVTLIVGVGYFLKYVHDQAWFGPTVRVFLVCAAALTALLIGEISRRRAYGFTARGMTALGFALLYAAVFSATRIYNLITPATGFGLTALVTAAALGYAVTLDTAAIAWLSLTGGYLGPLVMAGGRSAPAAWLLYPLALVVGVLVCNAMRRWRAINWVALCGTYLLYFSWLGGNGLQVRPATAALWLGVFGGLFMLMPVWFGLWRKLIARGEDVGLLAVNCMFVFYGLWDIADNRYPRMLALAVAALGMAHLALMALTAWRCPDDRRLRTSLGLLGAALLTAVPPLYFTAVHPPLLIWALEALVLTYAGLRYRRRWLQLIAMAAAILAVAGIFNLLPLHSGVFRPVFNAPFLAWMFVTASIFGCHFIWRRMPRAHNGFFGPLAVHGFYIAGVWLAALGGMLEWRAHCHWNLDGSGYALMYNGAVLFAAAAMLALLVRPIAPRGRPPVFFGVTLALAGVLYVLFAMVRTPANAFPIFVNGPFIVTVAYCMGMLFSAWRVKVDARAAGRRTVVFLLMVMTALILAWWLLAREVWMYWHARNLYAGPVAHWRLRAQMYISIVWAVYGALLMVAGFVLNMRAVRCLALFFFAVLLGKIFLLDTAGLRAEYRIAAFITTGLILVGVSFLYQHARRRMMPRCSI